MNFHYQRPSFFLKSVRFYMVRNSKTMATPAQDMFTS
jgi:hypothetical protein